MEATWSFAKSCISFRRHSFIDCLCVSCLIRWREDLILSYQSASVSRIRRVILEEAWKAEVWHLAHKVAVDQDVSGSKVTVHIIHVGKVFHARGDAA